MDNATSPQPRMLLGQENGKRLIKIYLERVAKWRLNEMPEGVAQGPKAELDLPPQDAFWYLWFHETNHKTRRMP